MRAELLTLPTQNIAGLNSRRQLHGGVEATVELGTVLLEGAVREVRPPMTDADGILQDFFDHRRERGVAALDGELDIPELVGEADLPIHLAPPLLRAQPVRDPEVRTKFTEELGWNVLFARRPDQMDAGLGVMEHPLPPVELIDSHCRLVAPHDGGAEEAGFDADDLVGEDGHRFFVHIADRAFTDLQPEHFPEQCGETLEADRLVVVEGHRQTHHRRAERRSRLQSFGHRRQKLLLAARANPAVTPDLRDHRLDRRYLDPLVELLQRLAFRRHRRRAVRAGGGDGLVNVIRRLAELPADPRVRCLGPLLHLFPGRAIGFLPARRRHAGVGWRLGWPLKLCLKLRNPRLELLVLGGELCVPGGECAVLAQESLNGRPQLRRKRVGAQRGECGAGRQMTHDSLNRIGPDRSRKKIQPIACPRPPPARGRWVITYQDIKSDPESVITEAAKLEEEYKKLPMCELENYFNKQKYHYSQRQTSGRLLFLANTCFGGHWDRDVRGLFNGHSGHQISQRSPDRQIVSPGQVMLWHKALQRTEIMCGDYHNLNTPTNCIVFCDPPYRGAKNDYDRPFDDEQQVRLFRWCTHLSNDTNVCIIQTNRSDGKFFEGMFNEVNLGKIIKFMTTNTNSPSKHRSMEIVMIWNPLFNNPQKYGIHFE